jgi:hypothetical protein
MDPSRWILPMFAVGLVALAAMCLHIGEKTLAGVCIGAIVGVFQLPAVKERLGDMLTPK